MNIATHFRTIRHAAWLAASLVVLLHLAASGQQVQRPSDRDVGRFREIPEHLRERMTPTDIEDIEQLEAIGYLGGVFESEGLQNVTVHDRDRAWAGYNFYTSGHDPAAFLMDMEGNVLHSWQLGFREAFPNTHHTMRHPGRLFWRKAHLYPNGDVLAIFEGLGIIKIDKDSNLIWANRNNAHHDLDFDDDGNIYVLTREAHIIPDINPDSPILEDFISVLTPDGACLREVSVLRALLDSPYAHYWDAVRDKRGDVFHTNTLKIMDGSIEDHGYHFRKGNVLVVPRDIHMNFIIDMYKEEVVWVHHGSYRWHHDTKVIDNGNILLFDNGARYAGSRVLEFFPAVMEVVWEYAGTDDAPFKTPTCGSAYRLPNGNTLICESDTGRAFEVTEDKEIVWEFYNPHFAGDNDEFIATLLDIERIDPEYVEGWLER